MLLVLFIFIGLLIVGRIKDELRWSHVATCLCVALGFLTAFIKFGWQPSFYIAVLAVLDIILLLVVFKGDIQIR